MPIFVLGKRKSVAVSRALTTTARTRPAVERSLQTWAGTHPQPVERSLMTTANTLVPSAPPVLDPGPERPNVEYLVGGPVMEYTQQLTGLPGDVLDWEYSHTGPHEELRVTVTGQHGLELPKALLRATGTARWADGSRTLLGQLPNRQFVALGQEPDVDVGADQTTFVFRNDFNQKLRGVRLPELIPWKLSPTPAATSGDCTARPRQALNISALVYQVLQRNVDPHFALVSDPLLNAYWIEEQIDFSTLNLTPQGLWDATYGLLGMELHLWPQQTGVKLVGRFVQPANEGSPSPAIAARWPASRTERREHLQTPTRLTVTGAPAATELSFGKLMQWVGSDPARDEIARAIGPDSEWFESTSADTGETRRGYRKSKGQLVAQVELTTGDVTAKETVDGKEKSKTFSKVALSYSSLRTTFDPNCADRPLFQQTENRTYAYTPFTTLGTVTVAGPGIFTSVPGGDLVTAGDSATGETVFTAFGYSTQGYLNWKQTTAKRLGSLQQENAEDDPKKRGKLLSKEWLTDITTESWMLTGAGRWVHTVQRSVQSLVPVYDKDSGEPVRTSTVTRSLPPVIEITDQAPPTYRCPDGCLRVVQDPTGAVFTSGDAGFGVEQNVSLPFLKPAELPVVGRRLMEDRWHRQVRSLELPYPLGVVPGSPLDGGWVRDLKIKGSPSSVSMSVTVAQFDTLFGQPVAGDVYLLETNQGSSIMLAGRPGGARVRLVKGWDPNAGVAIAEDAFVAFRTGFPPTPGDEINWTLSNGRREAQSAR